MEGMDGTSGDHEESVERVACAGGIVVQDGRLLLVRRRNEPAAGTWSLPGGRVLAGESVEAAVTREVLEETGLVVDVGEPVGRVELAAGPGRVYVVDDLACRVRAGELAAGDDAVEVRWYELTDVADVDCSPGLVATLRAWGVLPR